MTIIWIIVGLVVLPFAIYLTARLISLGIFNSFFEVKSKFTNSQKKEKNNVIERQTEKKEG